MKVTKYFLKVSGLILLVAVVSCSDNGMEVDTLYVPADYETIQAAIDAAEDGQEIIVDPGEYHECLDFLGKYITLASQYYYSEDEQDIYNTIVNADSNNSAVTFQNQETGEARLIGFTLINGYAGMGGGIYCSANSSPSISNVVIQNNSAIFGGGVGCYSNSKPILSNVVIRNNTALDGNGGGICSYGSSPIINDVEIYANSAENGGGIFFNNSSAVLNHVIVKDNISSNNGGGIYIVQASIMLQNCIVENNEAWLGGAFFGWRSSLLILENSTIYSNEAKFVDGIFLMNDTKCELMNSILWQNGQCEIGFNYNEAPNTLYISYSNIQGMQSKINTNNNGVIHSFEGNINNDPIFIDPHNHNFTLSVISPCINSGNPGQNYTDSDGTRNDMGAYGGDNGEW